MTTKFFKRYIFSRGHTQEVRRNGRGLSKTKTHDYDSPTFPSMSPATSFRVFQKQLTFISRAHLFVEKDGYPHYKRPQSALCEREKFNNKQRRPERERASGVCRVSSSPVFHEQLTSFTSAHSFAEGQYWHSSVVRFRRTNSPR